MVDFQQKVVQYLYLPASALFIWCIKDLTTIQTSKRGILLGTFGMIIAFVATLMVDSQVPFNYGYIAGALAPFIIVGIIMALKVGMTGMPQMVGLLNSFGGLAAALSSIAYYDNYGKGLDFPDGFEMQIVRFTVYWGTFIGIVTFIGSIWACLKLNEKFFCLKISGKPVALPFSHFWNILAIVACIVLSIFFHIADGVEGMIYIYIVIGFGVLFGFHWVSGIGGADMPVVISVLNSCSGISGCLAGFTVRNDLVIIAGALVGASGAILSYVMCAAMGRSFLNVMVGGFGGTTKKPTREQKFAPEVDTNGVIKLLQDAQSIVFAPGYGMAVAQAQHVVSNLIELLRNKGKKCAFAIHPVAGRLPGHMNVLLAEAKVPYDIVFTMDEINSDFKNTDLVFVVGANDTVNPAALEDPTCDIAGMPVLHVWDAKNVIVVKRSRKPGFSGVPNTLFERLNTLMYYGDAKKQMQCLIDGLNEAYKAAADNRKDQIQQSLREIQAASNTKGTDVQIEMEKVVSPEEKKKQQEEALLKKLTETPVFKKIGVLTEITPGENRVAVTPSTAERLRLAGFEVLMQAGAGLQSSFTDEQYAKRAAVIIENPQIIYDTADIIIKINPPKKLPDGAHEIDLMRSGQVLISPFYPATDNGKDLMDRCLEKKIIALAMDCVPRITRAQKCDILSSMSLVSGYKAVIEAASQYGSFFTGQMTAAGKTDPVKILVIGAGVAGLAIIGAARSLGAIVRCFDVRPVCKDQVESLGGEFLEVDCAEDGTGQGGYAKQMSEAFIAAEKALFYEQCRDVDIVMTTALIPNRPAPILIEDYMVKAMKPGSVIIDLAALGGGNVEGTIKDKINVTTNGVKIIGYTDFPSRMPAVSSQFFSTNICCVLDDMGKAENFQLDLQDDEIGPMVICIAGEKIWPPKKIQQPQKNVEVKEEKQEDISLPPPSGPLLPPLVVTAIKIILLLGIATFLGWALPSAYLPHIQLFIVAAILGYMLIWNVTPALHTPLMSITNAISGTVVLSAIIQIGDNLSLTTGILSFIATAVATINVFGGFAVTQRMLNFFSK